MRLFSLFFLVFIAEPSFSRTYMERTWGIELTFTNDRLIEDAQKNEKCSIIDSPAQEKALAIFKMIAEKNCAEQKDKCSVKVKTGKYGEKAFEVVYDDKFKWVATLDPYVIEVNATPLTLAKTRAYQERLQQIFDWAALIKDSTNPEMSPEVSISEAGLIPHKRIGNGHLHIGISAFLFCETGKKCIGFKNHQEDTLLFRNFIVDYTAHPTLPLGILGALPTNSPPLAILGEEQIHAFKKLIEDFDNGVIKKDMWTLADELKKRVYTKTYCELEEFRDHPDKYQALNINRIICDKMPVRQKTIEVRGQRPQRSAKDLLLMVELLSARLDYLQNLKDPLPIKIEKISPAVDPKHVLLDFQHYIENTGLSWEKYRMLLSEEFFTEVSRQGFYWDGKHKLTWNLQDVDEDFRDRSKRLRINPREIRTL